MGGGRLDVLGGSKVVLEEFGVFLGDFGCLWVFLGEFGGVFGVVWGRVGGFGGWIFGSFVLAWGKAVCVGMFASFFVWSVYGCA